VAHAQQSQPTAAATVPKLVRFGGSFHPTNGMPVQPVESVTLSVYRDQTGGTPLWQETQNVAVDGEGKYSVLMGATQNDGVPLELLSAGEPRWLGAQFNRPGEAEQPRVLMASVPYALKSVDAETLGGKPASAYLLAPSGSNASSDTSMNVASNAVSTTASGTTTAPATSTSVMTHTTAVKPRTISGQAGFVPYFTDASNDLGDSVIQQSGGFIGIGTVPGAGANTTPSLDLRTYPFSQIGMAQTVDYLGFFSSDQYGPAIYWNPGKDLRLGKAGAQLYGAFGFVEQMRIQSATGNVGIGTMTPGSTLDVAGNINLSGSVLYQGSPALQFPGGLPSANTALGLEALTNNTTGPCDGQHGCDNTAAGARALGYNTTGADNTAVGSEALATNTSGSDNTAAGVFALTSNTTGSSNTAAGGGALLSNTSGSGNTALGFEALFSNISGSNNVAVGYNALLNTNGSGTTTGYGNTAIGTGALQANVSGNFNLALGNASGNAVLGSDNIEIANFGLAGDNGVIRIGNSLHTTFFAAGIYNVAASSGVPVLISSSGQLGTTVSSRRYKEDIQDMGDASRGLMDLRPVTFRYKKAAEDGSKPLQYGLIAEEVAEVYPDLVVYSKDGLPEAVQYQNVNAMLLNEVQKQNQHAQQQDETIRQQQELVAQQQEQVSRQQQEIRSLEARLAALEALLSGKAPTTATAGR